MRRPFAIHLGDTLRRPGSQVALSLAGTLDGVALSSARTPEDADVQFDGTVEAQGAQVVVQGRARAPWVGECRRCLGPTGGVLDVAVREVFEDDPVEGETFPVEGDQVDLAPVLHEALALALPLAPLCTEDCAGPDPEAHPVGGEPDNGAESDEAPRDPRWAALDDLEIET